MQTIHVAAAIIINDNKILATKRGYGKFKGGWEFPGGKLESYETAAQAVVREIQEELCTKIEVLSLFDTVEYDYDTFHLTMDCFLCSLKSENIILTEHEDSRWLTAEDLYDVTWLPADISVIHKLSEYLKSLT